MTTDPKRERFETLYAGTPPWDLPNPQPAFVAAANKVTGNVLDAGCGTGSNALYFAERGHDVLGIDFLDGPLRRAQQRAAERGVDCEFLRMDALTLVNFDRRFDSVIDCGLFHVFSDEDRAEYVRGLTHVVNPGGRLFLMCFSENEPGTIGPRRITRDELRTAFGGAWSIESIAAVQFQINPDADERGFSEGGPKAWFCIGRRNSDDAPS